MISVKTKEKWEGSVFEMSLTSIIILTLNKWEKTQKCLESIRKYTSEHYELIIVDNGSTDGTVELLKKQQDIKLVTNGQNRGFATGCNQGIQLASGTQLLFLNNDTIVSHHWLSNMLQALNSNPNIGMVGPLSNFTVPTQVLSVGYLNEYQYHQFAFQHNRPDWSKWKAVRLLSGFCLLFKRELLDRIGGMDEQFKIGSYEDIDYCYRACRAGYTLLVAGDTFVHHDGNSSFKANQIDYYPIAMENRNKFIQKWGITPESLL
jgi:O-antigen biosynthesis protein